MKGFVLRKLEITKLFLNVWVGWLDLLLCEWWTNQWNRIESREINVYLYDSLICNKDARQLFGVKSSVYNKRYDATLYPYLIPMLHDIQRPTQWVKSLNVSYKI